jgi:putative methanogen marker protein 4
VSSLRDGEIDAAVRGTLSSSAVLTELKRAFSLPEVLRVAVLEDHGGRPFLLAPVGIDEGMDMQSRLTLARATVKYFEPTGWSIRTGVLSKGRTEDASRGEAIRRSLDEGEQIAAAIRADGGAASHYSILIEDAVKECDLVLAPDGVSGNLMFRTLHFVGGGRAYGAPVVNMDRVFVDTSRGKKDFADSVMLAAGLASLGPPSRVKA